MDSNILTKILCSELRLSNSEPSELSKNRRVLGDYTKPSFKYNLIYL